MYVCKIIYIIAYINVLCGVQDENKRMAPLLFSMDDVKDDVVKHEIDCDQTAMGLPPVTSVIFLIAKLF
jgi:hypothetical protein